MLTHCNLCGEPLFHTHLRAIDGNPMRHRLTCHESTSALAVVKHIVGSVEGEVHFELINIRPCVAVHFCKQTF